MQCHTRNRCQQNCQQIREYIVDKAVYRQARLPYYLDLGSVDIDSLVQANLMRRATIRVPRQKLDYGLLALSYQEKLDSGMFPTRAALARHLGVSRAWVTMVMTKMKPFHPIKLD